MPMSVLINHHHILHPKSEILIQMGAVELRQIWQQRFPVHGTSSAAAKNFVETRKSKLESWKLERQLKIKNSLRPQAVRMSFHDNSISRSFIKFHQSLNCLKNEHLHKKKAFVCYSTA
jgi:hypothetical protein